MGIIKTLYSVDEEYKVEIVHRVDDLYQIEVFHWEKDDHPVEGIIYYWLPISKENILTDTLDNAVKLAEEKLEGILG